MIKEEGGRIRTTIKSDKTKLRAPYYKELKTREDEIAAWLRLQDIVKGPMTSKKTSLVTLIVGIALLAFHTQFLSNSIGGLMESAHISQTFIGIVLLPILGNDLVAIQSGFSDNMEIALLAALGKSCQVALLVIPCLILVGWGIGIDDMDFVFNGFQVTLLFVVAYLVQVTISNGMSH
jgi:Ca2+:H+ antiporter